MQWIKTSKRLPEGTVVTKHPRLGLIGELSIYDNRASFSAYPSYHILMQFSDTELYELEWLDETPPKETVVAGEGEEEMLLQFFNHLNNSRMIKNMYARPEVIVNGFLDNYKHKSQPTPTNEEIEAMAEKKYPFMSPSGLFYQRNAVQGDKREAFIEGAKTILNKAK